LIIGMTLVHYNIQAEAIGSLFSEQVLASCGEHWRSSVEFSLVVTITPMLRVYHVAVLFLGNDLWRVGADGRQRFPQSRRAGFHKPGFHPAFG